MGSVMSDIECMNCGYEYAFCDFYYKSGEEYIFCGRCGSSWVVEIVNRPKSGKYPEKWKPKYKKKKSIRNIHFSYGEKEGVKSCGSLLKKEIKDFEKHIKENPEINYAIYTFKKKGKWYTKDIINNKIEDFKSRYDENE